MLRNAALLALLLAVPSCAADAAAPEGFAVIGPTQVSELASAPDSPARRSVLRSAERALQRSPEPRAKIHTEGTLPHEGIYDDSVDATRDFPAARDLALASRLTGDARFAMASSRFIAGWADRYRPSFNPIDETGFDALFIAWDLLPDPQRAPLRGPMNSLLRAFCAGYLAHPLRGRETASNNWNSHRVKLIALSCFALGDAMMNARAHDAYRNQIAANINPDGTTLDFALRDAIHYVAYDLEPLTLTAIAARAHGEDWAGSADGRLPRAIAWLVPYADGSRAHQEFAHTTVAFDITRRNAGVPGFAGPFDPRAASLAIAYAARLDGSVRAARASARLAAVARCRHSDPLIASAEPRSARRLTRGRVPDKRAPDRVPARVPYRRSRPSTETPSQSRRIAHR